MPAGRIISKATMEQPTYLSARHFFILKTILVLTQVHVETLIIFSLVKWLELPFFWTLEVAIGCIFFFQLVARGFWNKFHEVYSIADDEPAYVREVKERLERSVIVKEVAR